MSAVVLEAIGSEVLFGGGVPITGHRATLPVKASRIARDAKGELVFAAESALDAQQVFREVAGVGNIARLEMVAERSSGIAPGCVLILAEYPYANGWIAHGTFKRGAKKGPARLPHVTTGEPAAILTSIAALEVDPWENGDALVAVPHEIMRLFDGDKTRNLRKRAEWRVGVLDPRDFPDPVENETGDAGARAMRRAAHEVATSPQAQHLLMLTEAGGVALPGGRFGGWRLSTDKVAGDGPLVLTAAAYQALAGPKDHEGLKDDLRVVHLLDWIYRAHLDRLMKLA